MCGVEITPRHTTYYRPEFGIAIQERFIENEA